MRYQINNQIQMEQTKLKNELFSNLKDIGLQDQLKKHLRIQLCEKLKAKDMIRKQQSHENKLYNRIMASLISEQLKMSDCGYSNSIYVAQSGYDDKVLQRQEMVEIMNINGEDLDSSLSILSNFMKRRYPFNGSTVKNISIQTNPEEVGYTLEQRLSLIDQQYRKNMVDSKENDSSSQNHAKLKEYEEEIKRQYQRDLERFKEFEAHSIKIKISEEWRHKYEEYSRNIEADYRRKIDTFHKKEKLFEDQMVERQKNLNEKVHSLQKTLKQKIQLLDMKSMTVQEHLRHLENQKKRNKEDYEKQQKQLRIKIRQYDDLLLNVNKKIDYEVNVAKLAIQQEYQEKQVEFLRRKKFIDEEYGKLMGIKDTTDLIQNENKRLFEENSRLRENLTTIEQELRVAVSENGSKGDRIESLRQQISQLMTQLNKRKQREIEDDQRKRRNQREIISLRQEVEELRKYHEHHQESEESINEPPEMRKTELEMKLEGLKNERKKEIEKLKMGL